MSEPQGDGDCFMVAANLVIAGSDLTLVHGRPLGRGVENSNARYWHAWVETPNGQVLDHANNLTLDLPVGVYYALGLIDPTECTSYSATATIDMLDEYRHWGPWNEEYPPLTDDDDTNNTDEAEEA
jgi:hypothetical protein